MMDEYLQKILSLKEQECYDKINSTKSDIEGLYCDATFDGWVCWPDTKAGNYATEACPEYITGFDPKRFAHRVCEISGEWFKHPESNRSWSNYTTCVDIDALMWNEQVNRVYEFGYIISLIAISVSLGILSYFRSLKCARITLHMHLFVSFGINNTLWLIWYFAVVAEPEVLHESGFWCVALHLVLHYFLLTNYAWMLCEGFYLHTVLVSAFISEKKLVRWLSLLGWITPAFVLLIYALLKGFHADNNARRHCWSESEGEYMNVLIVPVCISMMLNLAFLCNIVRVLLLKLRAPAGPGTNQGGPSRTILQAFRATLLLVPLLGLQYMLTPFRPSHGHPYLKVYEIISALTASFQGLWVATLFCFFNGEVIAQMKRKWGNVFTRARANSYTATQVSGEEHQTMIGHYGKFTKNNTNINKKI